MKNFEGHFHTSCLSLHIGKVEYQIEIKFNPIKYDTQKSVPR